MEKERSSLHRPRLLKGLNLILRMFQFIHQPLLILFQLITTVKVRFRFRFSISDSRVLTPTFSISPKIHLDCGHVSMHVGWPQVRRSRERESARERGREKTVQEEKESAMQRESKCTGWRKRLRVKCERGEGWVGHLVHTEHIDGRENNRYAKVWDKVEVRVGVGWG
eukprot:1340606-Amorphochlora_amoeboformis.AAC.1